MVNNCICFGKQYIFQGGLSEAKVSESPMQVTSLTAVMLAVVEQYTYKNVKLSCSEIYRWPFYLVYYLVRIYTLAYLVVYFACVGYTETYRVGLNTLPC